MRDTEDIDEIDVVLTILYNPERGEYAVLEKSRWHQDNRDRFNTDEGGYPHEIPGGGIELERPYTENDLIEEGVREIKEELNIDEEELEPVDVSGSLEKVQDGVHHTFYATLIHTSAEVIQATSDEHESAELVPIQEYYDKLGFNEIWALRQFHKPF